VSKQQGRMLSTATMVNLIGKGWGAGGVVQ
jgi:hypothetical protein